MNNLIINRDKVGAVWDAIRTLPPDARPKQVLHAFDLVLVNMCEDTGEVMLTRYQFAEEIGCTPNHVSTAMGTLERMGVIRREHRRVDGIKGRGIVVYFVNPHIAWNDSLDIRKAEAKQANAPTLTLMEGGKNA